MHSRIQDLVSQASELAPQWGLLVDRWGTASLPDETPYARLHGATFNPNFPLAHLSTGSRREPYGQIELVRSIPHTLDPLTLLHVDDQVQ